MDERILFDIRGLGQRFGKPTILAAGLGLSLERVQLGPQLGGQSFGRSVNDNHNLVLK
jgi:hypothetical protein